MRRTIALTSILVTSIVGIALGQSYHHGDANSDGTTSAESTFASQMMQAMDRMDSGMMAAKPTGDPDRVSLPKTRFVRIGDAIHPRLHVRRCPRSA